MKVKQLKKGNLILKEIEHLENAKCRFIENMTDENGKLQSELVFYNPNKPFYPNPLPDFLIVSICKEMEFEYNSRIKSLKTKLAEI